MNEQQQTIVGPHTQISGHIQGTEDLIVFGRVDGQISLEQTLTVEPSGVVVADVTVQQAVVSGTVVGNITATEAIHIAEGGKVVGDLQAPRVVLVDGALFRGNIDMGDVEHTLNEVAQRQAPERTAPTAQVESAPKSKRAAPRPARPPRRVAIQAKPKAAKKAKGASLQDQANAAAKAVARSAKKDAPKKAGRAKSAPLMKKSSKKKVIRKVPKPPTTAGKKSRAKRK